MELFKVVTVDEAKSIINGNFSMRAKSEKVALVNALGRIVAKDIFSGVNVPGFARSTVDGYAVRSRDVAGASEAIPAILNYKGEVYMGKEPIEALGFPGDCMYVPTGGMLPNGADCVVMIEYTDRPDEETVLCYASAAPGENVVAEDEDVARGELVIKAGKEIRPYEIGLLSAIGQTEVEVYQKTRIGIISTGDEIVDTDIEPAPGQVRDINTYLLHALTLENGAEPVIYGVAGDEFHDLLAKTQKAYEECDIVLISGGSSVGKKDQTLRVMGALPQAEVLIHGIAVKPGKPTIIAKAGEKIVFGLPGHPLACAVIFKLIVKHYLDMMTNSFREDYPIRCKLGSNYHKAKGREEYLPVFIEEQKNVLVAHPIYGKAGLISGFAKAWGYVKIAKNIEGLQTGETVFVYKL